MKRQSRRQAERQRTEFEVRRAEVLRTPLSANEAGALFAAMRTKQVAPFGLVKLAHFELNERFVAPPIDGGAAPRHTLIEHATALGRDAIIAALLRAGADPSVSAHMPHGCSQDASIVQYLWQQPPAFACWAIRTCVALRHAADQGTANTPCSRCGVAYNAPLLAAASQCAHTTCEVCFWQHSVVAARPFDELRCAHVECGVEVVARDAYFVEQHCALPTELQLPAADETHWPSADAIREFSMSRWLALPIEPVCVSQRATSTPENEHGAHGHASDFDARKPRFCALPRARLAALFVGTMRAQRCTELERAATSGNVLRLLALIVAGVNVDERNEYGQTALLVAVWRGHASCVHALLRCGADASVRDNAGVGAWHIARACKHDAVCDVLTTHGVSDDDTHNVAPVSTFTLAVAAGSGVHAPCASLPAFRPPHATDAGGATLHVLVPPHAAHAGAGSYVLDGAFDDATLARLEQLHARLPCAPETKRTCSERAYYCDALGLVQRAFALAMERGQRLLDHIALGDADADYNGGRAYPLPTLCFPHMRFLNYVHEGGFLPAHIDLSRTDDGGRVSTHTSILYLRDCGRGGETALLRSLAEPYTVAAATTGVPAAAATNDTCSSPAVDGRTANSDGLVFPLPVTPLRGRLLFFPHACPHEGLACTSVPKLLLRGELH